MIDAGMSMKKLSEYMGHASVQITMDRYSQILPHNIAEDAALFDAYLDRADTRSRIGAL
jgi:hypothetical protein